MASGSLPHLPPAKPPRDAKKHSKRESDADPLLQRFVILPGDHGNRSYPDLLVALPRMRRGISFEEAHRTLKSRSSFMLAPRQFLDFVDHLLKGEVHIGTGEKADPRIVAMTLQGIVQKGPPARGEWLDSVFSRGDDGVWRVAYRQLQPSGLLREVVEDLEPCLMSDDRIDFQAWREDATSQGMPPVGTPKGYLRYFAPIDGGVAHFAANSAIVKFGCHWLGQAPILGVREAKLLPD